MIVTVFIQMTVVTVVTLHQSLLDKKYQDWKGGFEPAGLGSMSYNDTIFSLQKQILKK